MNVGYAMHMDFVYRGKGDKDSNVVCINYYNALHMFSISKMYTF